MIPWLSDDSKNRFSVIGSALKEPDCIGAYAHVDQLSMFKEAEGKWIVEYRNGGDNLVEPSELYVITSSLFINNDSSDHCSGLCGD